MKHALASPDPDELADDSIHASKRCKPHDVNASSLCLDRAFKHRMSDTPPLIQETLDALNCTAKSKSLEERATGRAQSSQLWADDCERGDELETAGYEQVQQQVQQQE
jgi:hypothetical protein